MSPIQPMAEPVEKVTIFIMGQRDGVAELLFLHHPNAGIQLPAGTVEAGESPQEAALREAQEETGLNNLRWGGMLGMEREEFLPHQGIVALSTPVHVAPSATSAAMAELRRGLQISIIWSKDGFLQVCYTEHDRYPNPQYVSFEVMGWVPAARVASVRVRHFAWLTSAGETASAWTHFDDDHNFTLRWHPLNKLPALIAPQAPWVRYLPSH
jgi:8-oxo-dGTP pyrophosphatase MutT (NUDIX family)